MTYNLVIIQLITPQITQIREIFKERGISIAD